MAAKTLIGTASWADKPIIQAGTFYPKGAGSAEVRLRFYSSQFPLVEIDSSYYALPSLRNVELWMERTPEDFTFNIKAFGLFTTHGIQPSMLHRDLRDALPPALAQKRTVYAKDVPAEVQAEMWRRFEEAVTIMKEAGKLGVIVFQFPPWFMAGERSEDHIVECRRKLANFRLAVEYRNHTWFDGGRVDRTLDFLQDHDITFIAVDEPQGFRTSVPPIAAATAPISIVRFHGRNYDMWESPRATSISRFDYWYEPQELREWAPRIKHLQDNSEYVHLVINTNNYDQGPVNARRLWDVLKEEELVYGDVWPAREVLGRSMFEGEAKTA